MAWKRRSMVLRRPTFLLLSIFYLLAIPTLASAKVKGACVNCHTMHNSQGGTEVALKGTGVGWDGSTLKLTGGTVQTTPIGNLLVADCVGCHSATTNHTIITIDQNKIPIVYNTVAPQYANPGSPSNALAGGNFYWVAHATSGEKSAKDQKGHNVLGISTEDTFLKKAPGGEDPGCNGGCHVSLAREPGHGASGPCKKNGCEGCHYKIAHHGEGAYRFLEGHYSNSYVSGVEDPSWEQNPTVSHNIYLGSTASGGLPATHTITRYCVGCHTNFHSQQGPWLRHPSDAVLPDRGEYQGYTAYNPDAPVARKSIAGAATTDYSVTRDSDMVMCLSCHRPHGSPYADILRWPYNPSTDALGAGPPFNKYASGCVICHTQKIPYSP